MSGVPNPTPTLVTPISERLELRSSTIHGTGVFARIPIGRGIKLIEYVGRRISKAESFRLCQENNEYIFEIDSETDLDGNIPENPARFINHGCTPNCEAVNEDGRIWVYTKKRIPAGAEISFNYGYDLQDCEEHPCYCGAPGCIGVILAAELHEDYQKRKQRRTDRKSPRAPENG